MPKIAALEPASLAPQALPNAVTTASEPTPSLASTALGELAARQDEEDRRLRQYASRPRPWWRHLAPSALDQLLTDRSVRSATTIAEMDQRALELATQMRLASWSEVAEAWTRGLKIGVRAEFYSYAAQRFEALMTTIEQHRAAFGIHIRERHTRLAGLRTLPTAKLADRYEASLDQEIDMYMSWLDHLLAEFKGVIEQRVLELQGK